MERQLLRGESGLVIAAGVDGPQGGLPVVLLHGGGQTRRSWKNGMSALVARGYRVTSLDARGHGESDWDPQADYGLDAQIGDLKAVLLQLGDDPPAFIGASMGGVTALAALGDDDAPQARALVLVDITPKINVAGAQRIGAFMRSAPNGFASLEEASAAVTAFNPHRAAPKDLTGLRRNLREVDGRLYWHWDPAFLGRRSLEPEVYRPRLEAAARQVRVPTLLVRGERSEIVGDAEVAAFRNLMPDARFVDVAGAGHMVAGDRNDAFNAAIVGFLTEIDHQGRQTY